MDDGAILAWLGKLDGDDLDRSRQRVGNLPQPARPGCSTPDDHDVHILAAVGGKCGARLEIAVETMFRVVQGAVTPPDQPCWGVMLLPPTMISVTNPL